VRDVVLHYFGCLRETERERYYNELPLYKQERIEKERIRIKQQRALFEAEVQTKDLVRKFKTSLSEWKPGHTRGSPEEGDTHVKLTKENAWGMNAYALFFRNSEKYTDKHCFDQFPNQKLPIKDLLYNKDKDTNPLMRACEESEIRYFHLPGNNMEWVEVSLSFPRLLTTAHRWSRKPLHVITTKSALSMMAFFDVQSSHRQRLTCSCVPNFGEANNTGVGTTLFMQGT
jgi:hypothetical protein